MKVDKGLQQQTLHTGTVQMASKQTKVSSGSYSSGTYRWKAKQDTTTPP